MQSNHTSLLDQLRVAFPPTAIDSTDAFSAWGMTYLDGEEYATKLSGKRWDELDRAYLALRSDALGFLGTSHLVAVLPAYLRDMIEADPFSSVPGMMTLTLTKPGPNVDSGLGKKRFNELVNALSESQRSAIAAALKAYADEHPETGTGGAAQVALDSFWHQFSAGRVRE